MLNVRVYPSAKCDEIAGFHANRLRVRVTAPAVDGKANDQLVKYLSQLFKVRKSMIGIVSGKMGRNKRLIITAPKQLPDIISNP